jgi:peptide-methionine (S)-S-oxide reductase
VDGVVRTCVGYAGGTTPSPTYDDIGDHIEAVRVAYDPNRLDYTDLLLLFWASHDPTRPPFKRQYQPALFPRTPTQAEQARASRAARAAELDAALTTEVIEDASFTRAEPYHQKHTLRRYPALFDAFRRMYPADDALTDSPAAALVNGYLSGNRAPRHLDADLPRLGLPDDAAAALRRIAARRWGD